MVTNHLALVRNNVFIRSIVSGSNLNLDNGTFVSPALKDWVFGDYSLHDIHEADLVPDGKQIVSTEVQNIGGSWKYVHVLADIIPPTPEERRALMPTLSSRQFWLAANTLGITEDMLLAATDDAEIIIEIRKTTEFHRTYDSVVMLAPLMGITAEQLDDVWLWATVV